MADVTPYLGLEKPIGGEKYSRAMVNRNHDRLEAEALKANSGIVKDRAMAFSNSGFAFSGGSISWDSGPLTVSESAESTSQKSPGVAFAKAGPTSGTIEFLEAGIYDISWFIVPAANPGNRQYTIATSGTWPGNPGAYWNRFKTIYVPQNDMIWETTCDAINVRVPTAGLHIRFQGQQVIASNNASTIRIVKKANV